jgi:hypothetical protein
VGSKGAKRNSEETVDCGEENKQFSHGAALCLLDPGKSSWYSTQPMLLLPSNKKPPIGRLLCLI